MPVFQVVGGKQIWIPTARVVEASATAGLLSTNLSVVVPANGNFPGGIGNVEVEGSIATVGAMLDGGGNG